MEWDLWGFMKIKSVKWKNKSATTLCVTGTIALILQEISSNVKCCQLKDTPDIH